MVKIWAHVFPTMDLSSASSVSVQNLQFSQRSLCGSKYILYCRVSGFRSDITLSWVVYWRFRFSLSSPIPHFLSNRSALIPWCRLSAYVTNQFLVLLTLTLLINLYTIKYWTIPMEKFYIALSNLWIPKSYLHWIVGSAHGTLLSTILMYQWKLELVLYSSSIEETSNKIFFGSQ